MCSFGAFWSSLRAQMLPVFLLKPKQNLCVFLSSFLQGNLLVSFSKSPKGSFLAHWKRLVFCSKTSFWRVFSLFLNNLPAWVPLCVYFYTILFFLLKIEKIRYRLNDKYRRKNRIYIIYIYKIKKIV